VVARKFPSDRHPAEPAAPFCCCSGAARHFYFLNFWRRLCHPFGPNVTTLRNRESPGKIFSKASARELNPLSSFAREQIFFGAAQVTCVIFIPVFSVA
jgi:hypothetical protein